MERYMASVEKFRLGRITLLILVAFAYTGCSIHPAPSSADFGYLVAGYRAKEQFALSRDTVPEVSRARVPAVVVRSAAEYAGSVHQDPECIRFFRTESSFLVVTRLTCLPGVKVADGMTLAQFNLDGERIGPAYTWITGAIIVSIHPYMRPAGSFK
jgi:hypothetical protein